MTWFQAWMERPSSNAAAVAAWSILAPPSCLWICILGPAHCTGRKSARPSRIRFNTKADHNDLTRCHALPQGLYAHPCAFVKVKSLPSIETPELSGSISSRSTSRPFIEWKNHTLKSPFRPACSGRDFEVIWIHIIGHVLSEWEPRRSHFAEQRTENCQRLPHAPCSQRGDCPWNLLHRATRPWLSPSNFWDTRLRGRSTGWHTIRRSFCTSKIPCNPPSVAERGVWLNSKAHSCRR